LHSDGKRFIEKEADGWVEVLDEDKVEKKISECIRN